MPDKSPQELARELVAADNNLTIASGVEQLQGQVPHLPLVGVKNLIVQALDEKHGVYYVVSGDEASISGPYVGAEEARGDNVPSGKSVLLLSIGDEANPMEQARRRLYGQFPDPADSQIVAALLDRVVEAQGKLRSRP